MSSGAETPPVVLAISGHDPTGAAGIHADIEAITQAGAACASLITATTAQNTHEFEALFPQPLEQFRSAAECLLSDMSFSACKVGMLGCAATARFVASLPPRFQDVPVVIDPITHAGTGACVAGSELLEVLARELVPLATVLTPNCREARDLTGLPDADEAAVRLLQLGSRNVLLTGADEDTERVCNRLYCADGRVMHYEFPRLPHAFHGSGCTLSASLAALLARGLAVPDAVREAQELTRKALELAVQLGRGQWHPYRTSSVADGR